MMVDEELEAEIIEEEQADTAVALTSGIVITTTVVLILALWVSFQALANYFAIGPLADK